MITETEFKEANEAPITANRRNRNIEINAPYVAEMVRKTIYDQFGEATYSRGFEVITSINGDLQEAANNAVINGLETYYDKRHGFRGVDTNYPPTPENKELSWLAQLASVPTYGNQEPAIVVAVEEKAFEALLKDGETVKIGWDGMSWAYAFVDRDNMWPPPETASDLVTIGDLVRVKLSAKGNWELGQVPEIQGALVSMSPQNGAILALVGGYDFRRSQVNRVTTSRPPGSNFKPFLYGAALENGYSAATVINDAPITRGSYRPNNYAVSYTHLTLPTKA